MRGRGSYALTVRRVPSPGQSRATAPTAKSTRAAIVRGRQRLTGRLRPAEPGGAKTSWTALLRLTNGALDVIGRGLRPQMLGEEAVHLLGFAVATCPRGVFANEVLEACFLFRREDASKMSVDQVFVFGDGS